MAIPFAVVRQRRDTCAADGSGRDFRLRGECGSSTIYQKIGRKRGDRIEVPVFVRGVSHLRGRSSSVFRPFRPVYRVEPQHGVLRPPADPPPRAKSFLFQTITDRLFQSFPGAALELSKAANLLLQELEAVSPQAIRGPDHLPRCIGLIQFALEPAALVTEMLEASAGAFLRAVRAIEVAVGVDQAA
jgi:hypothetical protein